MKGFSITGFIVSIMKNKSKVKIKDVTPKNATWLERHEYYLNGKIVGHSELDLNGMFHRGSLKEGGQNVFASSPEGIALKIQKRLTN